MYKEIIEDKDSYIFECPHCECYIIVSKKEVNCKIFRHGAFKNNFKQMNPHEKKNNCDNYSNKETIYGCSKPFRIVISGKKKIVEKCDYI